MIRVLLARLAQRRRDRLDRARWQRTAAAAARAQTPQQLAACLPLDGSPAARARLVAAAEHYLRDTAADTG